MSAATPIVLNYIVIFLSPSIGEVRVSTQKLARTGSSHTLSN
jgi:hypothetical protein